MGDHPQIKAFLEAAAIIRAERYWLYGAKEEQVEFLCALREVLAEVCFHLDAHRVLPQAVLKMCQEWAGAGIRDVPAPASAALVLISYLDGRIEQLIAESNDSGNTGAEGNHGP
jgi:hypothetical protein